MPYAIENRKYGFKKEATRGIAEAAPQKFLAVGADALDHLDGLFPVGGDADLVT